MTDRDRLIELLRQVDFDFSEECVACCEDGYKCTPDLAEFFADHLLANGVIVPVRCKECKNKGWVQEPCHGKSIDYCRLHEFAVYKNDFCSYGELKEREGNG